MERVSDLTEQLRRESAISDFMYYVGAHAAFPLGAGGHRNAQALQERLKANGWCRPHLDQFMKSAVAGGTTQSGNWGENVIELTRLAREWVVLTQAQTFIGRLPYVRVPFLRRVITNMAPNVTFVGPGVGIAPASITTDDIACLKRTAVATVAVVTNELMATWGAGVGENLQALLTRSVIRGMDAAALNPDSSAVTDERPASLLNGVSPIGLLGSTVSDVLGQVQDMLERLVAGGSDLRAAAFAVHPYEAIRLSTLVTAEGVRAFPDLTSTGGSILGIPAVVSVGCQRSGSPSERVFAVIDGAQIIVADDGQIDVSASDRVTLQMDDSPTQDARVGTGSSLVSMFQTETTAIKLVRAINWQRVQDVAVAWCRAV